jgi:hypothetical protein
MSRHAEYIAGLIAELPPPTEAEKAYLKTALAPGVSQVRAKKVAAASAHRDKGQAA